MISRIGAGLRIQWVTLVLAQRAARLVESGLFDQDFYLAQNADVARSDLSPLIHYLRFGGLEGRDPHPLFSTSFYLSRYPDARKSRVTPLESYLDNARKRDPNPLFRTAYYLERNPEVADLRWERSPLAHFVDVGTEQDQDPHPLFSTSWYRDRYPDIAHIDINPLHHFFRHGIEEYRDPHPLFDTQYFLARAGGYDLGKNPPVLAYLLSRLGDEAPTHPLFDPQAYARQTPDLASSGLTALEHFVWKGASSKTGMSPLFDREAYVSAHPQAVEADSHPLVHYIREGSRKGWDPHPLFDTKWYQARSAGRMDFHRDAASHYLTAGGIAGIDPHPLFDREWYAENQMTDEERSSADPFVHFLGRAGHQVVDPSPLFDVSSYLARHPQVEQNSLAALAHLGKTRSGLRELRDTAASGQRDYVGHLDLSEDYQRWIDEFDTLTADDHARIAASVREGEEPLVSILVPVHDPPMASLRAAVESVLDQIYSNWELCIADDGSKDETVRRYLAGLPERDARIRVQRIDPSGHICKASNRALEMARGELIALLDHDDVLRPHSIALSVLTLREHSNARFVYSDEDYLDLAGARCAPFFKPDWNRELLHSYNYICHFSMFEKSLIGEVGGFREGTEGAQDWDLFLRMSERLEDDQIRHIPRVLYHWRQGESSCAMNLDNKPYANRAGWRAVQGVIDRGARGRVRPGPWIVSFRLDHDIETPELTSIITYAGTRPRLLPDGVQSLVQMGHLEPVEILASVDAEEVEDNPLPRYVAPRVERVDPVAGLGPYRSLNEAAKQARGECLIFVDGCFRPNDSEWAQELVSQVMRPGVGIAGGRILYPDGSVHHAGYVLGLRGELGVAGSAFRGLPGAEGGYVGRAQLRQEKAGVSVACLAIRRELFEQLGGFDVEHFPVALGALDLCLRAQELGHKTIWTPFASGVLHQFLNAETERAAAHPGLTPSLRELEAFRKRWGKAPADPHYNPNLSLDTPLCDLALPPRQEALGVAIRASSQEQAAAPALDIRAAGDQGGVQEQSADGERRVRTIAFYLPQYHPIPENDAWWGKGFTEWRSVSKAAPLFSGHQQPHRPGELGFYDLRVPEVRERQAELAYEAGISAFCYYHYWFDGKRLLEHPFNSVLSSGEPDFPFCLAWANENWTRRWDGSDDKILIAQTYAEGFAKDFIRDLFPAFEDPRYLRVDGKPLFLVYRPSIIPDCAQVLDIWREEARAAGIGDLHLCSVQSCWNFDDPTTYGFEAAVEFPPHLPKLRPVDPAWISDPVPGFSAWVYDYRSLLFDCLERPRPDYTLYRGVMPSWDNTARRSEAPMVIQNLRPDDYAFWLEQAAHTTFDWHSGDERLLFVNAWNEWGEGCYLEPGESHGNAFLEATRDALARFQKNARAEEGIRTLR